jgi:hypothetical protein
VWRVDRKQDNSVLLPEVQDDDALHPVNTTEPQTLTLGDPELVAGNIAEPVWTEWRHELESLGGPSPLLHFVDEARTRIELSSTHPGGLPQFIMGKNTLLSSLIRDEVALRNARVAAGAITAKGIELRSVRGIDAIHLAIGLASWRTGGEDFTAPVLLRPVAMRRYGKDFELKLKDSLYLNPELARVLREQFQITLDSDDLVALALTNGVFKPQPVIDRLRALTVDLPWFSVQPRLVVSTFADVAGAMIADVENLDHPMLDALAGNPSARVRVESAYQPVDVVGQDHRPPATDTLLLDSDEEQEKIIAQIGAGNSLVVKTLPGTGGTQTIVNAIGALVAQNKRLLVVSPRRSSLDGIAYRLGQTGLAGLAVTTATLRRSAIQSIARNEKAERPRVSDVDDALVRLRKVLLDYRTALGFRDEALGASVLDALSELARLSLLPVPPATTARLDRASAESIAGNRAEAARTLVKAAALGEFRYGPGDSPWYGASFSSTSEATAAHSLAKRLHGSELPRLLDRAHELIGQTRMRDFETIEELGIYLRLLGDLRETLDKFRPDVFDRPLTELILATSTRRDAPEMSGANRRRLKKLALEYLRPGVHVSDMNESLRRIQQQRTLWQRYAAAGVPPEVPVGIADVTVAHQKVMADLDALDRPIGRQGTPNGLARLHIDDMLDLVAGLAEESEVLANLQERTALLATLRDQGLDPLLGDLSARHVPGELVASELELAWWQSVLEMMLADDRALLGANTGVLDRLEADFRLVDDAHAAASGPGLAWQLAESWRLAVVDHPEEAEALRRLLRAGEIDSSTLQQAAPHLARTLTPLWLASPYDVPNITDKLAFDAVFIVDAGASTLAENVGAIRRARQVVAFGDPVTQTPSPFTTGVGGTDEADELHDLDVESLHGRSALAQLSELLPVFTLTRSYRAGGDDLAELINRRFYGGRIDSLPWAGTFLGHGSLTLNYVKGGHGMPDPESGAVESVDAEVAKVVELVLDHAAKRPNESLMVVTASARHAVRVHQAVLAAFGQHAELSGFLVGDSAEPFTVVTLEQSVAQSRDRVVFSIGYGRTPHGRLLSNFGPLGKPGGERLLAVGLTRARRSMDIVSCFRPDDIDPERVGHGMAALAQVLDEAAEISSGVGDIEERGPLLLDLAARLERRGLTVRLGYRGKLALVASRRGRAVAVETDAVVARGSLRESLRLRPEVLRRLGWHYLRVHSFELFSDPDAVAGRIARLIGAPDLDVQTAPITIPVHTD